MLKETKDNSEMYCYGLLFCGEIAINGIPPSQQMFLR